MQREAEGSVSSEGVEWRLSFRAVRVHNNHIQAGRQQIGGCGVCGQGLAGAMAPVEEVAKPDSKDEVVEGDGVDESARSSPSYSDWADYWGKNTKVLE